MEIQFRQPSVLQICDHVYLLNDNDESTGYVVIGNKCAAVIDTMIGLVDVKAEVQKLTDLPVICINTHGHIDHIGGNWSFEQAYINPADLSLAEESLSTPQMKEAIQKLGIRFPDFLPIDDEQIFDLGGLELQAFYLPGHTAGEIVLLDREDRILFTGDGVIEQIWMQLPESLPLKMQIKSMQRIQHLRTEYDMILTGHSRGLEAAELFDELLAAAIDLENGNTANDIAYQWFGGICKAHPYGREPRRIVYQG